MNEEIRVHVVKYPGRKNLMMRYLDPMTGKQVARTAGTSKRRAAEKKAAKWEAELQEGRYLKPSRWPWAEFRHHHSMHVLSGMKPTTASSYDCALDQFEKLANPQKLADVTTARVTAFTTALRERGNRPATVAHHLRHLKAVLRWAHRQGFLLKLPTFEMPKQQKGMRGRPITAEEFDRMLDSITKGLFAQPKEGQEPTPEQQAQLDQDRQPIVDSWTFYLRGLWASGLRVSESLTLSWNEAAGAIVVDLSGRRPMLRIPAEAEKGNTHRLLPVTPEFAELLRDVPEGQRRGWVFSPLANTGQPLARSRHAVGPKVSAIGKAAGVVTDRREVDGKLVYEFASAHDLRRAFGFRWSRRVMPTVLRELMRHESIETTMQYYVGVNAEATADELWRSVERSLGNTSGNTSAESETAEIENI